MIFSEYIIRPSKKFSVEYNSMYFNESKEQTSVTGNVL